ncbi:MAG: ferredoxin family protein [Deltaproteobacteria bacterium]|nr:ferredoxin family protein [Candidatus Anaeroferrophillus wilburensis]MBN2888346.1 ferredoxin family protein [Deltaproteobacteria bacterium]
MSKKEKVFKVEIRRDFCKGCGLCIEFCKQEVLGVSPQLNRMGYHYAEPVKPEACVGCMVCTMVCPDVAVEVYSE